MSQSPLAIEFYFVRKSRFEIKKGFIDGAREIKLCNPNVEVETEIGQNEEDPKKWRVELDIHAGNKTRNFPYSIELGLTGFFQVLEGYPDEKAAMLVEVNGASILYAAAREFIMILTGRGPYQPLMLQSLSFIPNPPTDTTPKVASSPKRKAPSKPKKT